MREVYPLPSVDETLAQLAGAKVFSKLDANSGFWQIPLACASRLLTTFITQFGRFCFNTSEHFQKRMCEILKGLRGILCQMEDVLVFGQNYEEHDVRLDTALRRIQVAGAMLNKEKCVFRMECVKFLGHIIKGDGISADPEKTEAVFKMPAPDNITELRRLMGMVNQLSKFSPNIAQIARPLCELLSTKLSWIWGPAQEEAFLSLKTELSRPTVLSFYDPNAETHVSADASSYGLGAVLLQMSDTVWKCLTYIDRNRATLRTNRKGSPGNCMGMRKVLWILVGETVFS